MQKNNIEKNTEKGFDKSVQAGKKAYDYASNTTSKMADDAKEKGQDLFAESQEVFADISKRVSDMASEFDTQAREAVTSARSWVKAHPTASIAIGVGVGVGAAYLVTRLLSSSDDSE